MASITTSDSPVLQSSAQLLILPVSSDGSVIDPILTRCKSLYPDNYHKYRQACRNGNLPVGTCLLVKRELERSGLGVNNNANRPIYLANLSITDHAYHPIRHRWLANALDKLYPMLYRLIRYDGLRHIAFLARPLLHQREITQHITQQPPATPTTQHTNSADLRVPILHWKEDILPLINAKLANLPKVRIEIHIPKNINMP